MERVALAERYAGLLATDGVVRGLIGPREAPRLWERHLLNSAVVADAIAEGVDVADVGTGAGLPGMVLAIRRPDLSVTLIEPLLRRTTFLQEVVDELGLPNVTVHRGRADSAVHLGGFDVVTSRAVAGLTTLLEWCMPLVRPQGHVLAMKGSSVDDEIVEARPALERAGWGRPEVLVVGEDVLDTPTTLCRVPWADPGSVTWPPRGSVGGAKRRQDTSRRRKRGRQGR
ncbi:16S rRNA (guanine(527)-N(7))-methyltransferase RsmG [Nocardioides sp. BSK12Z-4]|uniref:Ribosomal RNA small subunit methyltransferase G n=1 Tax=Nocardioides bruguierae TaxID=2945102 RepID=A0A9X2IF52_9ACTN|nr:16S rRNA (guanine(527)-N(7))-methyltransferase RsmG [Nocardioides bruguierae]MCM0620977.1 16S rRNA (guanine(527)-N(7))-methyltransferase RsmG [Nocardioides bruguierae]